MAGLTETQRRVLVVLYGQSPGYLINPHATAFVVEGLAGGQVEATLGELLGMGLATHVTTEVVQVYHRHVTREELVLDGKGKPERNLLRKPTGRTVEVLTGEVEEIEAPVIDDATGEQRVVAEGWHITDEGHVALSGSSL